MTVENIVNQVGITVLIDNNSNKETLSVIEKLKKKYESIEIIYNRENLGIGTAFNQGVSFAKLKESQFVLTLDQDSISSPKMVEEMLNVFGENGYNPMMSMCPKIIYSHTHVSTKIDNVKTKWRDRLVTISSGHLSHINMYNCIGEYNNDLFIDSVDFDFSLRIKKAGGRIIECASALLYQQLGETLHLSIFGYQTELSMHNPTRYYYMTRNHIYILKNYFKDFPLYCAKILIGMILEICKILLFEAERPKSMDYIRLGIKHGIHNQLGKLEKEV